MYKKILVVLMLLMIIITGVSCGKTSEDIQNNGSTDTSEKLQILKTDLKLTQEQVMSQIKAQYLLENNGYKDDDEIIIMITLDEDSLIDTYNAKYADTIESVSKYASTIKGQEQALNIKEAQDSLIKELEEKNLILGVEHRYQTIINAISVKVKYGNLKNINNVKNVESTIIADTFNRPKTVDVNDVSAIENLVDVYETGIFNSSSVSFTGEGTAVAVLDSGFDCSHSVFQRLPEKEMITQQKITEVLHLSNAASTTRGLELSDVYYSKKIPFVYDYADKDPDVFPYDSEHGTHVAGIIGGHDDVITGVAVNTQLVLLKVFPDLDQGAETDDILAALEDAVLLGVDAINMSLGSSCGFAREEDGNKINDVYDAIHESGISLITAASNDYSSGFGGAEGNTNKVTNPDSGTVGSPSTYKPSLSVASISGTKSHYILGNSSQIFFFKESSDITGKENHFVEELGLKPGETRNYEYVTIPGVGKKVNFTTIGDLTGKIALIRRGDNTFEEKAQNAKNAGAVACIIYNNIEGDISMSMGKSDHIPTISISKDDGTILAARDSGTLTISYDYQAGPFMSDFSSWGPTPSLQLKPEITAHGGNIKSAVPGGGYDEQSGTSMACPNLCGIVVLIRQYIKEKYPTYTAQEISLLTNRLLMSTGTIVKNEQGNPYSPRKQGAGLASLSNSVNTKAYIVTEDSEGNLLDRTKLELFDDPDRTGIYEMIFNIVNISDDSLEYDLSIVGMTESVSTSDDEYVSEKSYLLGNDVDFEVIGDGSINGTKVKVGPNQTVRVKATYTLSKEDKDYIDKSFPYGMYVEGFVKLDSENEIDLNIPFLGFYGDWTEAPLFDKTYYEVESEAHNKAIDDEDKLKADYFATTPYGSYFYNYIIPLGTYLYDMDTNMYDAIPGSEEHIAISNYLGTIDGIYSVYAGLLRGAKTLTYTITDKLTGEVVYEHINYNAFKAHANGGTPIPNFESLKFSTAKHNLINNREYEFKMQGLLDYKDGGVNSNIRNTFEFDFVLDDEAPVLKDVQYEKIYDKSLKKDRYYITMTIYDNHYVQSITPIIFTSSSSYNFLSKNPIPVYSEKGTDNTVRFEITDYLEDISFDALLTSGLGFSIDDYALNSNIYLCQLPGTRGEFKFTKDGTMDGADLVILSMYEGEVIDITKYLATSDNTVDINKDYLKHLSWSSSDESIAEVKEGQVKCLSPGRVTITVQEAMELKQAVLIINVKENPDKKEARKDIDNYEDEVIESLRFSYFDTLFAYSRAAQTSEIGSTGDRIFLRSVPDLSFYPGEKIQLHYDLDPWYVEDKYNLSYSSTNPTVATVDEEGVVTGLSKGTTTIVLSVEGSNILAKVRITIKSEFVIENRMLIAYKGLGGHVEIPDDEGILYISSFAFCLYETDRTIELPEDDYDANKIPSMNTSITSVTIPEGVEDIQKYAFYNCSGLKEVKLPSTIKFIREYAFYQDVKLEKINLENVLVIGARAFFGCSMLNNINTSKTYSMGAKAFEGCTSLEYVDLRALRNSGKEVFKDCTSLKQIDNNEHTKLSYAMFVGSGITSVDIYEKVNIPEFIFAKCNDLKTVTIHNDIVSIGYGAFSECPSLTEFNLNANVEYIEEQAFYKTDKLTTFTLPNCEVRIGNYCFYQASSLEKLIFQENTFITTVEGTIFKDTNLSTFEVDSNNPYYSANNELLLSKDGKNVIFVASGKEYGDYTLDSKYEVVEKGAFSGVNLTSITFTNPYIIIEDYAFANCDQLTKITFTKESGAVVKNHAFNYASSLESIENLSSVKSVGDYAFANSAIKEVVTGENVTYGEGVFFKSSLEKVTLGANSTFGLGCFQSCLSLKEVVMPDAGNVHFGITCFAYCASLEIIDLTKVDEKIESQTFYGCKSLKVALLDNVKVIGDYAFADCSTLINVRIPVVEVIGEGAFSRYDTEGGAPTFNSIELPNTLREIKDGAFLGCEGLGEITIPKTVRSIGDYTFAYCLNLEKVVLPSTIKTIGLYSFAGCELLTNINTSNIEEFKDYAFTSCVLLENVDLSKAKTIGEGAFAQTYITGDFVCNDLTSVGSYAFQNANILSFVAPSLQEIHEGAFQGNRKLKEFTFSKDLSLIESIAFLDCDALENYYFVSESGKTNTSKINDYALLNDGMLYTVLKNGHLELASIPAGMKKEKVEILEDTYRIDMYAGSKNKNIKEIVLPDTLRSIGNYAFYGYDNLKTVEFKSFIAPKLEDYYNSESELTGADPGYEILHKHFDLFGYFLCYYNFIDLVGKKESINMILPNNENIEGYDSIVYEVYFGKVEDAARSEYEAMDKSMINFIEYATKLSGVKTLTISHENLVNEALRYYNSVKQDPTVYGIDINEWNKQVELVQNSKKEIARMKLEKASAKVQNLQVEINNLDTTFDLSKLEVLRNINSSLNELVFEDKALLDLTKYNELVASYHAYFDAVREEITPTINSVNNSLVYISATITSTLSLGGLVLIIIRKRMFM